MRHPVLNPLRTYIHQRLGAIAIERDRLEQSRTLPLTRPIDRPQPAPKRLPGANSFNVTFLDIRLGLCMPQQLVWQL